MQVEFLLDGLIFWGRMSTICSSDLDIYMQMLTPCQESLKGYVSFLSVLIVVHVGLNKQIILILKKKHL